MPGRSAPGEDAQPLTNTGRVRPRNWGTRLRSSPSFKPLPGRPLDLCGRLEPLDSAPEREEGVARLLLRRERDVLEAPDVDPPLPAVEPERVCAAVELDAQVGARKQREHVRQLVRARYLEDHGCAGETRGHRV